jgi:hypothetical protein
MSHNPFSFFVFLVFPVVNSDYWSLITDYWSP